MTDLQVSLNEDAGCTVVSPSGKICFDNRELLQAALEKALATPAPKIVIDLGAVSLCDSSGLQLFINAHRHATEKSGWLRLADPQPLVRKVLDITRLTHLLPIFDSVRSAAAD